MCENMGIINGVSKSGKVTECENILGKPELIYLVLYIYILYIKYSRI